MVQATDGLHHVPVFLQNDREEGEAYKKLAAMAQTLNLDNQEQVRTYILSMVMGENPDQ